MGFVLDSCGGIDFFGVPYLNDAITCGGVNSIGQFSSKIVELVDGWKLPGLSSQGWIDIFMALIVVILLGISIWPAIVAYKKPKAVIDNDGEVTTKAASVEKVKGNTASVILSWHSSQLSYGF